MDKYSTQVCAWGLMWPNLVLKRMHEVTFRSVSGTGDCFMQISSDGRGKNQSEVEENIFIWKHFK